MKRITNFRAENYFLSNFAPASTMYKGVIYPTAENAFQAAKCKYREDRAKFLEIGPAEAKRYGRHIALIDNWENIKVECMYQIVKDKFTRNPDYKHRLLETGDAELVEGNTWNDTFWGICNGEGENQLGKILMRVRKELKGD